MREEPTLNGAQEECNKDINEEGYDSDIVIEGKKRKTHNSHLSRHVSRSEREERMMVDENYKVDANKDEFGHVTHDVELSQMRNFLSAGPGEQACREK
ncbi:hypothetical protein A2U01_0005477 [Trifolium medium]|uniref:Uncharacterized protein n=1 Tax=Trifolium medium TaxID=97028 RepID=A0A392MED8_9FABA|nr:hypothetical protein [Trifolium medium]